MRFLHYLGSPRLTRSPPRWLLWVTLLIKAFLLLRDPAYFRRPAYSLHGTLSAWVFAAHQFLILLPHVSMWLVSQRSSLDQRSTITLLPRRSFGHVSDHDWLVKKSPQVNGQQFDWPYSHKSTPFALLSHIYHLVGVCCNRIHGAF